MVQLFYVARYRTSIKKRKGSSLLLAESIENKQKIYPRKVTVPHVGIMTVFQMSLSTSNKRVIVHLSFSQQILRVSKLEVNII